MKTEQKQTIIFDIDGVLINWSSQLPLFCKRCGIDPAIALKFYTAHKHADPRDLFGVSNQRIALELVNRYNLEHGKYLTAFPDAVDHLYKLAEKYNLVALTSFGATTEHWLVRKYNIETFFPRCFSELITIDLLESKAGYVNKLKVDHDVVGFVDDQLNNINAIKNSCDGVPTCHLNRYDDNADIKTVADVEKCLKLL